MDPLSITASMLAIITATVKSTQSLYDTVHRFKDRHKTLRRLQDELSDLINILNTLKTVENADPSMMALLQSPIDRCNQVCREFEQSMKSFSYKTKTGIRDWTKLEFMRGDINEFIETVAGYKSTIVVGLGTINMHNSNVSMKVIEEYNEMVQDTAYNLEVHLQQIDEKMTEFKPGQPHSDTGLDLQDEKTITKQCLRICNDAKSYIETLKSQEYPILQEQTPNTTEDVRPNFEAQIRTRQALSDNSDKLVSVIGCLQERLQTLVLKGGVGDDPERCRLLEDINTSKQCLEVCKVASQVSQQKIYRVGEVIADGDSDQVVVNTLADLFDVGKAQSTGNSAQLVGSMTAESLHHLAEKRYNSRFGALSESNSVMGVSSPLPVHQNHQDSQHFPFESSRDDGSAAPVRMYKRPSPNEIRKRAADH